MRNNSPRRGDRAALAGALALFFIFLELLKAHRASQWSGILPHDVAGITVVFLAYAAALVILSAVASVLLRRVGLSPGALRAAAPSLAGVIVWALLSIHREHTPTADDALVIGVLAGAGGAAWLGPRSGWWRSRQFAGFMALCWLAANAALIAAGEYFLYAPDRARWVTLMPAGMLLSAAGVLSAAAWIRGAGAAFAAGLLLIMTPPLAASILPYAPHRPADEERPNLVFVIADTLRADYCGAYGGPVPTPALERLAARGMRFDQHYALAPWTLPSMTGLFSSQYPKTLTPNAGHGQWSLEMNQYEVDASFPALAEQLSAAGYATGAFTANAFLPSIPGMMAGIQAHASSHPILLAEEGYLRQTPLLGALVRAWLPALADIRPHNTTIALDRYAQAFIRRHRDQPFYLWVHYIDPHAPYDPPACLRRVPEGPWPFFHPYAGGEEWGIPILGQNFAVDEEHRDYVRSLYEGEVTYVDAFVGRLMDALERAGVGGETYVCFTSDHGEELWDHGAWGHGQSLYEEQIRVPLIVAGPGVATGVETAPVSAIHLLPTLAELMGADPSAAWRGTSLAPALRGEAALPTDIPIFALGTTNRADNPKIMVRQGDYKLIRTLGGEALELYNLADDPGETRNIAGDQPDAADRLNAMLDAWLDSFPAFFGGEDGAAPEFNRDLEQGLEGMGYL
ncbi:MAG: sulfatase [Candidatus Hydrogenedentes bacterium]|nr:sulfatase [Candidatus Hydrogenedentota bacterium]